MPNVLSYNTIDVEFITDQDAEDPDGNLFADISLLLTSLDGELELLGDQQTIADADENSVIETGTLEHFSDLVKVDQFRLGGPDSYAVEGRIKNVPDIIALNTIFTVDARLILRAVFAVPSTFDSIRNFNGTYTDNSIRDIIPAAEISIEALLNHPDSRFIVEGSFDYLCNSTEETSGRFEAIMKLSFTIPSLRSSTERTLVKKEIILGKRIVCPAVVEQPPPPPPPPPTMPPPTEPPVVPALEAADIDGSWDYDCFVLSESFPLIIPNLGDPFSFQADTIVNPDTLETMILPFDEIFELDGFLMQLENGDFSFSGDGTGFLGDTNPGAANIILKAEDWNYSLNVPGPFSGDNQPGDVFVEGVLRFNFPTFPLNGQSSLADCTGMKIGD